MYSEYVMQRQTFLNPLSAMTLADVAEARTDLILAEPMISVIITYIHVNVYQIIFFISRN